MDYKKFLGRKEVRVLPHFGGVGVEAPDRLLRLDAPLAAGWWRFEIKGRKAAAIEPADPDPELLENLPVVRGHLLGDRIFRMGAVAEQVFFLPPDDPPRLSVIKARRWPKGQVIFESVEFDTDAEETARRALEDRRSLANEPGIPATLRVAFGFAVASELARQLRIPVAASEIAGHLVAIADQEEGRAIAERELRRIAAERVLHRRRLEQLELVGQARDRAREIGRQDPVEAELWAEDALRVAGAELLDARRLDGGLMEVTYRFMNERFLTIVDRETLRVVDAGICLAGHDDRVTLESLAGVIRQAIEEHRLVIARHHAADPLARYHWEHDMVDDPDA